MQGSASIRLLGVFVIGWSVELVGEVYRGTKYTYRHLRVGLLSSVRLKIHQEIFPVPSAQNTTASSQIQQPSFFTLFDFSLLCTSSRIEGKPSSSERLDLSSHLLLG
ncbi:hypothetical protein L228DRAFT_168827 [Xylona heveae TC161]|uniref:Secreted protein n=1 Tax=Xylona heveae (strain CBS 132557 / TC161) TaxID=1328760 RepID=A0A165FQ34_XYLHT|nr:hypothetical protein L228DRAFT_168827 [Xylona heveae TC161]KZF21243.1 hypothetical protein L228DRAFT_168827 [Xylona heveae TC161]